MASTEDGLTGEEMAQGWQKVLETQGIRSFEKLFSSRILHLGSVGLCISFGEPVNCLEFFMQAVSCVCTCIFLGDMYFFHFLSHSKKVKNG